MKSKNYIVILCVVFCGTIYPQYFNSPESIAFDSASKSYFVSNYGDGSIIKIDSNETKSFFQRGLSNLFGLTICKGTLFVVESTNRVSGFDISNRELVFEIFIKEAQFLNDITCDDIKFLYVTDIGQNIIFRIDVVSKVYIKLLETQTTAPNGIVYDKSNHRLLVCYFTSNASIDEIELEDLSTTTLISTQYCNFDGITLDKDGNCYVSSFGTGDFQNDFKKDGAIYKFDKYFDDEPIVLLDNLHGSADIYFNIIKSELAIPLFLDNEVIFKKFE